MASEGVRDIGGAGTGAGAGVDGVVVAGALSVSVGVGVCVGVGVAVGGCGFGGIVPFGGPYCKMGRNADVVVGAGGLGFLMPYMVASNM